MIISSYLVSLVSHALTSFLHSSEVPMHCRQWRRAVNPSLKPPSALLAGLSADPIAMVP